MIQLSDVKKFDETNIDKLVTLVRPELRKKQELYKRYTRKMSDIEIIGKDNNKQIVVPFERYIVDIASGYLGGKEPTYEVEDSADEDKNKLIEKVLDKKAKEQDYKDSMETLMNYITNYNDDGKENYSLVHDILSTGSAYEIIYENMDNEIVYSRVNPIQTQAIWDYSIPKQLIGVVRIYEEADINGNTVEVVQLTDNEGTKIFKGTTGSNSYEEIIETDEDGNNINNHNWGDVPFTCVEVPDGTALFEPVLDLIDAYEELIKETKETFTYNANAKLKVTGYRPTEELLIRDEKSGKMVENPVRKQLDETLLNMQVFYTPDDGDIAWITKQMEDSVIQNTLKTYIDLIMMNTGVPQTTDLGFTKADNASAIDRKFFSLEQTTTQAMQLLKMAYKRRWELIFGRINLKGNSFDFRDIKITLNRNLPANENEIVDMYMKLRGLISDETIIERLPLNFDATSEMNKMEEQDENNLNKEVERANAFNTGNDNSDKDDKENDKKNTDKETDDDKEKDKKVDKKNTDKEADKENSQEK